MPLLWQQTAAVLHTNGKLVLMEFGSRKVSSDKQLIIETLIECAATTNGQSGDAFFG